MMIASRRTVVVVAAAALAAVAPGVAAAAPSSPGGAVQGWEHWDDPYPEDFPRPDGDLPPQDEPVVVGDPVVVTDPGGGTDPVVVPGSLSTGTSSSETPSPAQVEQYLGFVTGNLETGWDAWFRANGLPDPSTAVNVIGPGESFQTSCTDETGARPVITADFNNLFYCSSDTGVGADGAPAVGGIVLPVLTLQRMWTGDILGARSAVPGDFAAAIAVAHEFGHSVVDELAVDRGLAAPVGKNAELIADCFAGVWEARVENQGLLEPGDAAEATAAFRVIGDTGITDDPHGTAAERVQALTTGASTGDPDTCTATYWAS
jgi:hypothetical protein